MGQQEANGLESDAEAIRRIVLEQSFRAGVGHIGSALSIADIVAALLGSFESIASTDDPDRDRLVLSKGHAALALYAGLANRGLISAEQLDTFCGDGTELGVHPEPNLAGIDFGTGSLGHGLSLAAGAALGAKWQGSRRRAFAILSDAEVNEGSTWEAAMFAAHHRLGNLGAIVDLNGQQALGYTEDVLNLPRLNQAWAALGWRVVEIDGHDAVALASGFHEVGEGEAPVLFLARTTFGKGVSFMESKIEWHYRPLTDDLYAEALAELREAAA
ncbi:MAG TPA: 1-deoxy-D-xylulose-5-phosphate synthase N-terminal domain-containing protein [Solirubrobacterales bacterium]